MRRDSSHRCTNHTIAIIQVLDPQRAKKVWVRTIDFVFDRFHETPLFVFF